MSFEILDLQQDTPEWHEWRLNGIGSSDASVITGKSPWKTRYQLWEEKLGLNTQETPQNYAMKRGKELEEFVRLRMNDVFETEFNAACVTSKDHTFLNASLDGISKDQDLVIEIKCPNKKDHELVREGKIPEKYQDQVAHLHMVTQLPIMYVSYCDNEILIHELKKIETNYLLEQELEFWNLLKLQEPPELTEKDYEVLEDKTLSQLAAKYISTQKDLNALEDSLGEIKNNLNKMLQGKSRVIIPSMEGNLLMQEIIRKGNVQYAKIPELKNVNLETYRANPSIYKMFKIKEQK